jgi:hypothetical protein
MIALDDFLGRLEGVRQTQPDRWIARCPAHPDSVPSLSIRETSDGLTLIHCFAGCDPEAIIRTLGLDLSDLFPPPPEAHCIRPVPPQDRPYLLRSEAVDLLRYHITATLIAAHDVATGKTLTAEDLATLRTAAERANRVIEGISRGR